MGSHWVAMSDTEKRPKRGFRRLLVLGLIVFAAILLHNLTSPDRYKMAVGSNILIDGLTGKTYNATVIGWRGPLPERIIPTK